LRSFGAFVFACLVLIYAGVPADGQQAEVDKERIEKLVGQLADDNWRARESAQKQLVVIGAPVVPFLKRLSESPVFEVRYRVREILAYIHVVDPEDAASMEKLIDKFDPGAAEEKLRNLVIELRRKKNVRYYLIDKIEKSGNGERANLARLLAMVEYNLKGFTVDAGIDPSTDILLSFARDNMLRIQLRLCALRTLSRFADLDAAATLADIAKNEGGKIADAAKGALETIRKKSGAAKNLKMKTLKWWAGVSKAGEFEKSRSHLASRLKFEEEYSVRELPFLGVVKNEAFTDRGGAHVERPWPGSGAIKAGVEAGDVIVEFDGRPVDSWNDIIHGIRRGYVEQKILLKVMRGTEAIEMEAVLGKRKD